MTSIIINTVTDIEKKLTGTFERIDNHFQKILEKKPSENQGKTFFFVKQEGEGLKSILRYVLHRIKH